MKLDKYRHVQLSRIVDELSNEDALEATAQIADRDVEAIQEFTDPFMLSRDRIRDVAAKARNKAASIRQGHPETS